MNERLIINLIPGDTFLHKLTGASKTRLFAVLIVVTIMTFDVRIMIPLLILSLIAFFSVKPDWKQVWWLIVLVVVGNITNLVLYWLASPDAGMEYSNGSTVLYAFNDYLIVTAETMWYLFARMVKMMATFFLSLTYILAVTPSEVAAGLYSMGLPYKICSVVSLALRYIPDIQREYRDISQAQQARGTEMSKKASLVNRLKAASSILIPLILSSMERIETISNAMELRRFGKGAKRTWYSGRKFSRLDLICMLVCTALMVLSLLITFLNGSRYYNPFM
jgi:energy-coupling factor transport system permease protein